MDYLIFYFVRDAGRPADHTDLISSIIAIVLNIHPMKYLMVNKLLL